MIEAEIYLYVLFMFLTFGEAVRNILIFSSFILWLATLKYRENKWILKKPVPLLFWGFMLTILFSVVFSIDPGYSFKSLRSYPLKAFILFCLISTVLSDEIRLKRLARLALGILVLTVAVGYYSYFAHDLPVMKPDTAIRHAWQAQFAVDINFLLPLTLVIFFNTKDIRTKASIIALSVISVSAIILSTSRGGIAGSIAAAAVWLVYLARNYRFNSKIVLAALAALIIITGTVIYQSPYIKQKFIKTGSDMKTLTERTHIWKPLIAASLDRPVFGWGYGHRLFTLDEPFENTPYKVSPVTTKPAFRNPHNPFLRVLFHQGFTGLVFYAALSIMATITFWRGINGEGRFRDFVLLACTGTMIGTYFVNAIVENSHITELALTLSIGMAAIYMKREHSDN